MNGIEQIFELGFDGTMDNAWESDGKTSFNLDCFYSDADSSSMMRPSKSIALRGVKTYTLE